MRDRMRSSNGVLYFFSIWAVCSAAVALGTYLALGSLSGVGLVGKIFGPASFFAAIATSVRRKKNGCGPTSGGDQ